MRIAFVTDAIHPYNKGGKETRIFELTTRLSRMGHDVHVYTMKWWDGKERTRRENGVTLHAICPKMALYHDERRSISEGILFGVSTLRLLFESFDVVDVDHMPYFPLFFMRIVCGVRRKPMIATWHEVWGRDYWREYLGRLGFIAATMERLSVKLPDRIIAVSPHTAARLATILASTKPVLNVTNGIDAQAIARLEAALETSDVIFVGRLLEHKNVDLLIRAVAELALLRPSIKCLIVGDGPERASLEALTRELGVTKNVIFKGFVAQDRDKLRLLKASKVFALPSTREGFGIVALEAMACGLSVVTVDHPDNAARYLITPTTGRLSGVTSRGIAKAIADLLDLYDTNRVDESVGAYNWDLSAQALVEVYAK
jgi:glycosyltransferase involved in cell wall biosynthesis